MAKKAELLETAKELGLEVTDKNTIAEIEAAIAKADSAEETPAEEKHAAKAGKRSEKSLREAEEKAEKEARKVAGDTAPQGDEEAVVKKGPKPVTRPLIERRGKKYQKVAELIEKAKTYTLAEALELATKTNPAKFDA